MNDYIDFIENKIKKNVDVEKIIILDNSHKHAKHKYFKADKRHLYLEIESKFLNQMLALTYILLMTGKLTQRCYQ